MATEEKELLEKFIEASSKLTMNLSQQQSFLADYNEATKDLIGAMIKRKAGEIALVDYYQAAEMLHRDYKTITRYVNGGKYGLIKTKVENDNKNYIPKALVEQAQRILLKS